MKFEHIYGADMETQAMNALRALIADRRAELRLSYADIAERGRLPKSTVHHLATRETWTTAPHVETLDALAVGLGLPGRVVRQAAAEARGVRVDDLDMNRGLRVLMASVAELTPEQQQQVAALVDSMRRTAGS